MSRKFIAKDPELEDFWRGIILYGRNVASYKFALAKALLELKPQSGQLVKLDDLAPIYARKIADHIKISETQGTFGSSKFLDACKRFGEGLISSNDLTDTTVRLGFANVIDAFHVVGPSPVPRRFFIDERKSNRGIRITDEFSELQSRNQFVNLHGEVEARWRLVETAWRLGVSRNLLSLGYDDVDESLFCIDENKRRKSVTGSRNALNGYQKGKCFYCFSDIKLAGDRDKLPDVDHFFPHALKQHGLLGNLDGVWNLVLSCRECNRGKGGKFDQVPSIRLLERLDTRNEFLIESHHPLRETLIKQTGNTAAKRSNFLNKFHTQALAKILHQWDSVEKFKTAF